MENKTMAIGTYGYIDEKKKKSQTEMKIYFAFAAALLVVPSLLFKTVVNAFSVAAIVMLIPAVQGLKQWTRLKAFESCPENEYKKISEIVTGKLYMVLLTDLILESPSGEKMLNMAVIYNNNIYGYANIPKTDIEVIEQMLAKMLSEENISNKKPVIHDNFEDFEEMVMMLAANEPSTAQEVGRIYHGLQSYCI